jgi:hypothetical protein
MEPNVLWRVPVPRTRTMVIGPHYRRCSRTDLSHRSSHHEFRLRMIALRLARTSTRNAARQADEYLREILEIRR